MRIGAGKARCGVTSFACASVPSAVSGVVVSRAAGLATTSRLTVMVTRTHSIVDRLAHELACSDRRRRGEGMREIPEVDGPGARSTTARSSSFSPADRRCAEGCTPRRVAVGWFARGLLVLTGPCHHPASSPQRGELPMSRTFSTLTLGLLVGLLGCPSGDDTSTSVADGSTGTPGTSGNTTEMTSADSTDGPVTLSTTDTPGTTTSEPETTGAGLCDPDPMGDDCEECSKANCCSEIEACAAVPECACFQDCTAKAGPAGVGQCQTDCMTSGVAEVDDLIQCSTANCLAECL